MSQHRVMLFVEGVCIGSACGIAIGAFLGLQVGKERLRRARRALTVLRPGSSHLHYENFTQ